MPAANWVPRWTRSVQHMDSATSGTPAFRSAVRVTTLAQGWSRWVSGCRAASRYSARSSLVMPNPISDWPWVSHSWPRPAFRCRAGRPQARSTGAPGARARGSPGCGRRGAHGSARNRFPTSGGCTRRSGGGSRGRAAGRRARSGRRGHVRPGPPGSGVLCQEVDEPLSPAGPVQGLGLRLQFCRIRAQREALGLVLKGDPLC
jgi:hypothetical protein